MSSDQSTKPHILWDVHGNTISIVFQGDWRDLTSKEVRDSDRLVQDCDKLSDEFASKEFLSRAALRLFTPSMPPRVQPPGMTVEQTSLDPAHDVQYFSEAMLRAEVAVSFQSLIRRGGHAMRKASSDSSQFWLDVATPVAYINHWNVDAGVEFARLMEPVDVTREENATFPGTLLNNVDTRGLHMLCSLESFRKSDGVEGFRLTFQLDSRAAPEPGKERSSWIARGKRRAETFCDLFQRNVSGTVGGAIFTILTMKNPPLATEASSPQPSLYFPTLLKEKLSESFYTHDRVKICNTDELQKINEAYRSTVRRSNTRVPPFERQHEFLRLWWEAPL